MKSRNIFLIVFIILLHSCSSKEHLVFNSVPIDGHPGKFALELTKSGFTVSDSTNDNEIILKGEFLNKDCTIHVTGTGKNNLAYKVIVSLPKEIQDSLQADFGKIQKLYTLKYGTGTSKYQKYKKRERLLYNVPGLALDLREGDYTKYFTESGEITLEVREGFISITYLDKLNNVIRKAESPE